MALQRTIKAMIKPGDEWGYIAKCLNIPAVTQGRTLDEVVANLEEAIELYFEGENPAELGFVPDPVILITFELEPAFAKSGK